MIVVVKDLFKHDIDQLVPVWVCLNICNQFTNNRMISRHHRQQSRGDEVNCVMGANSNVMAAFVNQLCDLSLCVVCALVGELFTLPVFTSSVRITQLI